MGGGTHKGIGIKIPIITIHIEASDNDGLISIDLSAACEPKYLTGVIVANIRFQKKIYI